MSTLSVDRLRRGYEVAAKALRDEANSQGTWTGELSSSPLSTATAIAAMQLVIRQQPELAVQLEPLVRGGLRWLVAHQNPDGGWGDTVLSHSNISTSTLCYASFHLAESVERHDEAATRASAYVEKHGGFEAIRQRYGKDKTFSVPILTQCALAGLLPWSELTPLPFELGVLPHWFYRWIRLPVVSYALPALIAIGQARHHHAPSRNPLLRWIRTLSAAPTLRKLESIQPESGGFLEATPLTSFVTMSLASMGLSNHPVARQGIRFLIDSVRPDGSWPIDTNLATWVTTLSVNSLRPESLPEPQRLVITNWLLDQQHRIVHRYTNAAPGGWAWTDLSGGVPDADDTPGAILALLKLAPQEPRVMIAVELAIDWLLDLQNSDGGWPTFCRGWGALPFDRSTPDLTAHSLRAFRRWLNVVEVSGRGDEGSLQRRVARVNRAVESGFAFLAKTQRADGTWLPLWFGNQFVPDDENPVYGVSRALLAYREWDRLNLDVAQRAVNWLMSVQNSDGGWGGSAGAPSTVEETSLAVESLLPVTACASSSDRGVEWLLSRIDSNSFRSPAPIGLYFAKLWYFERLYPLTFAVSALARALEVASR